MVIEIKLFGALKKFGVDGIVALDLPEKGTILHAREAIKTALSAQFPTSNVAVLIDRSVLADLSQVLPDEYPLCNVQNLSLLPPVCGG